MIRTNKKMQNSNWELWNLAEFGKNLPLGICVILGKWPIIYYAKDGPKFFKLIFSSSTKLFTGIIIHAKF